MTSDLLDARAATTKTSSIRTWVLLVDDDRTILEALGDFLQEQGYLVVTAGNYADAIDRLERRKFHAVLCDLNLPDRDGFEVLNWCRQNCPESSFLMTTGYGTIEGAVEAIRLGAFDYLTKPLIDDELLVALQRALSQRQLVEENKNLRQQLDLRYGLENVIGHDYRMLKVFDLVQSVADTRTTVLIEGESGTGKTLCARAIHRASSRRDGPFVEVACGALPETLLESELFGHKAGSFTGAIGDRMGKFKQADGGTIFLDEIATASPALQVKLLRVLQDMEFEAIGSAQTERVDARVVLASNQDLAQLVTEGKFRQDLYYRINVVAIDIPPLRDRIRDIALLSEHFLAKFREQTGRPVTGLTEEALHVLQGYHWPGNVRELENVIERAVVLGKSDIIRLEDLPPQLTRAAVSLNTAGGEAHNLKQSLADPERRIILQALENHEWNRQQTADALGINRTTLYKKMRRLGLEAQHGELPRRAAVGV